MFRVLTGITVLAMVISGCGAESGSSPADARSVGGGADLQALGVTEADKICAKAYSTLQALMQQESRPQDALALDGSAEDDPSSFAIAIRKSPDPTYHALVNADDPQLLQALGITSEQAQACRWQVGQLTLDDIASVLRYKAQVGGGGYTRTSYTPPLVAPRDQVGRYSTLPQGSGGSQSQGSENQPRCWNCWQ